MDAIKTTRKKSDARRSSVYLQQSIIDALELPERSESDESMSARMSFMIDVAYKIGNESDPNLTQNEWLAICDALNGHWYSYERGVESVLRSAIMSIHDSFIELDEKWSVDCRALAIKIAEMSLAQRFSVVQIARRFWSDKKPAETWNEKLKNIGALK